MLAIDNLADLNVAFVPSTFAERSTQALRRKRFTASATDQLHIRDPEFRQHLAQLGQGLQKVLNQNGFNVVPGLNVKA